MALIYVNQRSFQGSHEGEDHHDWRLRVVHTRLIYGLF